MVFVKILLLHNKDSIKVPMSKNDYYFKETGARFEPLTFLIALHTLGN